MALVRADLGSPHVAVCPKCRGRARVRPLLVITETGVTTEPWSLLGCPDCGLLTKWKDQTP